MAVSNDNAGARSRVPIPEPGRGGDCRSLANALARVIVRRELIFASLIEKRADCSDPRAAG